MINEKILHTKKYTNDTKTLQSKDFDAIKHSDKVFLNYFCVLNILCTLPISTVIELL